MGDGRDTTDTRILEEFSNSKLSQDIRLKLGANCDSRQFLISSSNQPTTSYPCSFVPSLLIENAEDATSDTAECGSSFIPPVSTLDVNGKIPNKKVGVLQNKQKLNSVEIFLRKLHWFIVNLPND